MAMLHHKMHWLDYMKEGLISTCHKVSNYQFGIFCLLCIEKNYVFLDMNLDKMVSQSSK